MLSVENIKSQIGTDAYEHVEKEANNEVSLALKMSLLDPVSRDKKYYRQRSVAETFLKENELFQRLDIRFTPYDIFNVLFRCKLFVILNNRDEYAQRVGAFSYVDESGFVVDWDLKGRPEKDVIDIYLARIEDFVKPRTLFTEINSFTGLPNEIHNFFNELFLQIQAPFCSFIDNEYLVEEYKKYEPNLKELAYTDAEAKRFFNSPSIGLKVAGSNTYAYFYGSAWLRTFLNLLRIGSFVYPGQIDFGQSDVQLIAPLGPAFLEEHSRGGYCWDEDSKVPWAKVPDGCLFLSFGYRGLSKMRLDTRTFESLKLFFRRNRVIFDLLKNPWTPQYRNDISPSLDILSTASQIPDLGAKILLIYCCLEHLFVPKGVKNDNKKYIVGGINALKRDLLPWFEDLYKLRCDYAHKGYVLKNEKLRNLVMKSVENALALTIAKLIANPMA